MVTLVVYTAVRTRGGLGVRLYFHPSCLPSFPPSILPSIHRDLQGLSRKKNTHQV